MSYIVICRRGVYNHLLTAIPKNFLILKFKRQIEGCFSGQVPEWSKGADLRSAVQRTRGFEPHPGHEPPGGACGSVLRNTVFVCQDE